MRRDQGGIQRRQDTVGGRENERGEKKIAAMERKNGEEDMWRKEEEEEEANQLLKLVNALGSR